MAMEFAHTDPALHQWAGFWRDYLNAEVPIEIGLYINDFTPVPGWTMADLTECNLSDYARATPGLAPWTLGVAAHVQIITMGIPAVFTTTDPDGQLCYGYFVFDGPGGQELWAQRFATPQLLVLGVPIAFTPRDKLKDCPDT